MNTQNRKIVVQVVTLLSIGLLLIALFWFAYVGLYLTLEQLFFPTDPGAFPADRLRRTASVVVFVIYLGLLMTHANPFLKALLSVAPNGVMIITIVLSYYQRPLVFLVLVAIFVAIQVALLWKHKVAWYFYFALAYSTVLGLLYAWPRSF